MNNRPRGHFGALLLCLGVWTGSFAAFGADNAALLSVTITNGTPMVPRTMFTQTWTFTNTGTTTWTNGRGGYTLNMIGTDTLGAIPLSTNTIDTAYEPAAAMNGNSKIAPGGKATYSIMFIVPETPGTYTDTFQLNSSASVYFGPQVTVQIVAENIGSTNQYDRSRAISYANNYAGYVVTDGYFWTNSGNYYDYGAGTPTPTNFIGDDCAHFVSCCIGSESHLRGGGLIIPSRTATYGEPGAGALIYTILVGGGWATEVSSLSQLVPGDVIGWNWEGVTNAVAGDIDHVTLYLGNGVLASHAVSALDESATSWDASPAVWHLIHIYDAPTMGMSHVGTNLVLSWGTNWTAYSLYSSTNLAAGWTKMSKTPAKIGAMNVLTNGIPKTGATFYRLVMP